MYLLVYVLNVYSYVDYGIFSAAVIASHCEFPFPLVGLYDGSDSSKGSDRLGVYALNGGWWWNTCTHKDTPYIHKYYFYQEMVVSISDNCRHALCHLCAMSFYWKILNMPTDCVLAEHEDMFEYINKIHTQEYHIQTSAYTRVAWASFSLYLLVNK